ncbi:sugar O-acetyltransferase [Pedobacter sp. MC2016-14]|uniref:sugar O-acetyltransferase n=1 Tax=Pedobacter sp. MC2016-14 TaxID=2897327 RepID=UPI001E5AB9FC|nr:sugar O-acetyltransferase [Pedobacter sp. MC2016-14]MCD0490045.1 sugar O-acetyltransferase [Pedobacter sp. MC2016-14]
MKSEKEKMLTGEYYLANDEVLVKERTRCKSLLKQLNIEEYVVSDRTKEILMKLLPNAHSSIYIEPPFHCDYGYNMICGENVYFNVNCVVLDVMPVTIGNNVFCAPGVQIYTATHPLEALARREKENAKPIHIGDDCWIGGNAIICPGVTIGNRCVIGAGAVVTKDIPDDSLAVGNPAVVIRKLNKESTQTN